uniref:Uncharacterized protein n=1 Tax=Ceratitis capitata TaxID=7213 RepID=W8ADV2_CERCA
MDCSLKWALFITKPTTFVPTLEAANKSAAKIKKIETATATATVASSAAIAIEKTPTQTPKSAPTTQIRERPRIGTTKGESHCPWHLSDISSINKFDAAKGKAITRRTKFAGRVASVTVWGRRRCHECANPVGISSLRRDRRI